jgi:hypothetical protein
MEKDEFEEEAEKVKEKGEKDQAESEQIGYFKANKERLAAELKQQKQMLE